MNKPREAVMPIRKRVANRSKDETDNENLHLASTSVKPAPSLRTRCNVIPVVLSAFVLAVYLVLLRKLFPLETRPVNSKELVSVDAIVTVAVCGFHATYTAKALRTAGEWKKPIYVLTDAPEEEDASLVTPINVTNRHPHFDNPQDFERYKVGYHQYNPDLWAKYQKTQLFQVLPESIQTVMFLDSDMLVQKPLARFWKTSLQRDIPNPNCQIILYPERWYTNLRIFRYFSPHSLHLSGKWNSGVVIFKRNESHALLQEWGRRIARPPFMGRDQGKLTESIEFLNTQVCRMPNRWRHVHNLADQLDRIWFGLTGTATFHHVASSKKGVWKDMYKRQCDPGRLGNSTTNN